MWGNSPSRCEIAGVHGWGKHVKYAHSRLLIMRLLDSLYCTRSVKTTL